MKLPSLLIFLLLAISANGQTALHRITFSDHKLVSFPEARKHAIYPLSEHAAPVLRQSTGRNIVAADYLTGVRLKTGNPDAAAQVILAQIADATGQTLAPFWNSRISDAKPATVLTGIGAHSVWSVFISPGTDDSYVATISYVIEAVDRVDG